jgi:hypothetical protein
MAPKPSYKSRKCNYCKTRQHYELGGFSIIEQLWPPTDDYQLCPICHEATFLSVTAYTGTLQEKEAERRQHEFGWYLLTSWLNPAPISS